MKIEAELSQGVLEKNAATRTDNGAVRVVLTTPKEVADPKRVTMGGSAVTFRSKS